MVDQRLIDRLIQLGNSESTELESVRGEFSDLKPKHNLIVSLWRNWKTVTKTMTTEELVALVKGLTLAEECFRWGGGSVSSVIPVYQEIEERGDYSLSWGVAKWIIDHTENPYAPFGHAPRRHLFELRLNRGETPFGGAHKAKTSLSWELSWEYEAVKQRRRSEREEREGKARLARQRAATDHRVQHEGHHHQNHQERMLMLERAKHLSTGERLQLIAKDSHPVDFYPLEFSQVQESVLQNLDPVTAQDLIEKLRDRRHGPWRALRDRLVALKKK